MLFVSVVVKRNSRAARATASTSTCLSFAERKQQLVDQGTALGKREADGRNSERKNKSFRGEEELREFLEGVHKAASKVEVNWCPHQHHPGVVCHSGKNSPHQALTDSAGMPAS